MESLLQFKPAQYVSNAGDRYDDDRNLRETAKLVRRDIKAAQKVGELPRGKYTVRLQRYAGGQFLRVRLEELRQPCLILNPDRVRAQAAEPHVYSELDRHSAPGQEILDGLATILARYNRSIPGTNWVGFYTTVGFSGDLERDQKVHILGIARDLKITARRWSSCPQRVRGHSRRVARSPITQTQKARLP